MQRFLVPRLWLRSALAALAFCALAGCSHLLFYPDPQMRGTPDRLGLRYRDIWLRTPDDVRLHAWFIEPKGDPKGTILFLHGNAQNISTHMFNVAWLASEGYRLFLPDYRGFGRSGGSPSLPGVLNDVDAAFRWLRTSPMVGAGPVHLFGQSIGAALGAFYVGDNPQVREHLASVILEAPFASYRRLARERLAAAILTWPLQYPLCWLLPEQYSPERVIAHISPVPLFFIGSQDDEIVPVGHTLALYDAAQEPKELLVTRGPHIASMQHATARARVLRFLARSRRQTGLTPEFHHSGLRSEAACIRPARPRTRPEPPVAAGIYPYFFHKVHAP